MMSKRIVQLPWRDAGDEQAGGVKMRCVARRDRLAPPPRFARFHLDDRQLVPRRAPRRSRGRRRNPPRMR